MALSEAQQAVVDHGNGPLLVIAGPGSGKTRVLTERVRRLLTTEPGHFRVLALTFTNKAAREMEDRLADLGDLRRRAYIGTLHAFCLEMLADRGKPVGVVGMPSIFERREDRRLVLFEAIQTDPELVFELEEAGDDKKKLGRIDGWLKAIAVRKAHPITGGGNDDPLLDRLLEAYDAGLRACGAYDYDDLLCLSGRLLAEFPAVAGFYRRLYGHVCIDEAQDLNEAQYAVLTSLCGLDYRNVLMVGDPKQSIYGFNTSSPEFMKKFEHEFCAKTVELEHNYRSARQIVAAAQALEPAYSVRGQLAVEGEVLLLVGADQTSEASLVADYLETLVERGHPDVEGKVTLGSCAFLGRTRYALLAVEEELTRRHIPTYRQLAAGHETESDVMADLMLALRILVNPSDKLHLAELSERWHSILDYAGTSKTYMDLDDAAVCLPSPRSRAVSEALSDLQRPGDRIDLRRAMRPVLMYGETLPGEDRRVVHDDVIVLLAEWDRYLRSSNLGARTITGFLSHLALGTTRQPDTLGVGLFTIHSAKGLEFDVVFVVSMADGVFPDYRAKHDSKAMAEERRNAFVAVTRAKRVLCFSHARSRLMPWGEVWAGHPSPFLRAMGLTT